SVFAAAFPTAEFGTEIEPCDEIDRNAACREIVRRALATSGPVSVDALAHSVGFAESEVDAALIALEAGGTVFRGHFTPVTAGAEGWCDRYNLERIHRYTLARLRAEIEPSGDREFAAFRIRWNHLGGRDLEGGTAALTAVLKQMRGAA